eukprot:m.41391 g.41391  ORF g.41391 m.41391 type:complete len:69 (-) comp16856_c2_seq1:134-340(-)
MATAAHLPNKLNSVQWRRLAVHVEPSFFGAAMVLVHDFALGKLQLNRDSRELQRMLVKIMREDDESGE